MKFVRLLLLFSVFVVPFRSEGQCNVNIPNSVTMVNGTLTISNDTGSSYFVGYGDSLLVMPLNYDCTFYIGEGGYLYYQNGGVITNVIYALPNSTLLITRNVDTAVIDTLVNLISDPSPWTWELIYCSPLTSNLQSQTSTQGSFHLQAMHTCAGPRLTVNTNSYQPNVSIETDFGEGNVVTTPILSGNNLGYAQIEHTYLATGNYFIHQVLYEGSNPVDSITIVYHHDVCSDMSVRYYNDINNDCLYDAVSEPLIQHPILVEVISNNLPIDTISCISGFNYEAYGSVGDVYQFKILELPGDISPACPGTGIITDVFQPGINATKYMGLACGNVNTFDFGINLSLITAANRSDADFVISNTHCLPQNGVVTMTFSPKYQFHSANMTPNSQSGNTASWNVNGLSAFTSQPAHLHVRLNHNGTILTPGDTVQTKFEITPITGDINPANNIINRHDTVTGPYDPNAVYVSPSGCVVPGTRLQYTVTFENMGNDTAHRIYVMDTLSAGFEMHSVKILAASHLMNVTKVSNGGYNILKFEFPNINLPDSSSPARHGMVMYTIDMVDNFPIGSSVTNKAGIYFDYMPAVLTNVAITGACWPASVNEVVLGEGKILIYPNPATEELTIKTEKQFTSFTITNSLGQEMMKRNMNSKESKVNIKNLSTGIYYISLKGEDGTEVRKFVKL